MAFLTKQQTQTPAWTQALGVPEIKQTVYSRGGRPVPASESLAYTKQTTRAPRQAALLGDLATETYGLGAQGREALGMAGKAGLVGAGVLGAGLAGKAAYDALNSEQDEAEYAHNVSYVYFSAAGRI